MKMRFLSFRGVVSAALLAVGMTCFAADLTIADNAHCDYQIVVPNETTHPKIALIIGNAANIMQEMFKANEMSVPIVKEADADAGKPGIFVGDTAAARAAGINSSELPVWNYVMKVSGRNVIIAGSDWAAGGEKAGNDPACSLGTVKGMTDFMREYCGTRFLAPNGLNGIEFLPVQRIVVPDDLDVRKEPTLNSNWGGDNEDIALIGLSFFSNVNTEYFGHTHELAVKAEVYGKEHPEYFALINGKRSPGLQLCYSNKDVQELIYKDFVRSVDLGFPGVLSLQADGFQPCQCDECKKLFGTENWTEKLWLLNKMWAERLLVDRPGKIISVTAYTVTEHLPKSFGQLPPNMRVSSRSTKDALEEWSSKVPAGLTTYLHAWGSYHLCGYLPVRTPLYAQDLVKLFVQYNVKGTGLDSPPALMWGMEGPTVYTYGRMLDDPKNNSALNLVKEYIEAAYGPAAQPMGRYFDELHHTLEAYARVFGVDDGSFQLYTRADGRSVRYLTAATKLRLIGFLYPPETLDLLEDQLSQAERVAGLSDKQKLRLALIRREFDYLNSTARVVHMYNAFLTQKNKETLDQLLTEMEKRRDIIMQWYDTTKPYRPEYYKKLLYLQKPISPDWQMYIGGQGFYQDHLLANGGGYLASPVPPFTWDIDQMRHSAIFEPKKIEVKKTAQPLTIDSARWADIPSAAFGPLSLDGRSERPGQVKAAYDKNSLYVLFEGELPKDWQAPAPLKQDDDRIIRGPSFTFLVAPDSNAMRYYRFSAGVGDAAMYDAQHGFIEDSISPLFDKDDTGYNPQWELKTIVAPDGTNLRALMVVPFQSMNAKAPYSKTQWKANFSRLEPGPRGQAVISTWSTTLGMKEIGDAKAFGSLIFE